MSREASADGQRRLQRVMSDNGSEFRPREFGRTVAGPGARQRFIDADEPQTNGRVERVQGAILEECGFRPLPRTQEEPVSGVNWTATSAATTKDRAAAVKGTAARSAAVPLLTQNDFYSPD